MSLTLRMIMNGKEVGSIIGKGGEIINSIREDSTAKIHITDGSVPERVVTVTGGTDAIFKAYTLMCKKLEDEDGSSSSNSRSASGRDSRSSSERGGLSLRLVVPASQCGSLIGKGGSKIKEIREVTGASIQVASDMLPGSTERSVTVSGSRDAVTQSIYHICCVMLESPAKGNTLQYQPARTPFGGGAGALFGSREGRGPCNPLAGLLGLGSGSASTLAAIASIAGSQVNRRNDRGDREERDRERESTLNMSVANDLIGSVIGKGGTKIAEIRQISGAMIRISKSSQENTEGDERQIVITGNPDSVALAKSLINMSLDLHKANMEDDRPEGEDRRRRDRDEDRRERYRGDRGGHDLGLAGLLAKPDILAAVSTLAQLGNISGPGFGGLGPVSGMSRSRSNYGGSGRSRDDDRRDTKRSKFAPY